MATSQVKADLDNIAREISNELGSIAGAITTLQGIDGRLGSLPANFSSSISEINGYTPTGSFETLAQDELAKLTTEFQAARTAVSNAITALQSV